MQLRKLFRCAPIALLGASISMSGQTTESDDVVVLDPFEVSAMKSFSDQAIPDRTPVSFSEIGKEIIGDELGSRDIPLLLNTTPSVFASSDSGGAGDARLNIRGFNQRNISILINGVPTNDIENGWLYWSNWDGLGDVTATIQVQRGLSNVSLPSPSVGGTMNIVTDPARAKQGGSFKLEAGNDSFYKATAVWNTGMLKDKFALTLGYVKKYGDGYARGTWTDGWAYYLGATWKLNEKNRIELFAIGAPQQHGQRTFASNIAAYDIGYAKSLGYTDQQIYSISSGANAGALRQGPVGAGKDYNQNYSPVSPNYDGQQYYWGDAHVRYDSNMMNERVNYFNKPQINLNWYSTISDQLELDSVFYYSGGRGGGSGTLNNGSSSAAFGRWPNANTPWGSNIDWDKTIASNAGNKNVTGGNKTAGRSLGILRNSVNEQDQFGIISKLNYKIDESNKVTAGVDWRTATIDHFREVRDLLGGSYYLPTSSQASDFWADGTNTRLGLGDKVDYFNTNTVDWISLFLTDSYEKGPVTAFGTYGYTSIKYSYTDHFLSVGGNEFYSHAGPIDGQQIKGGVRYAFNEQVSAYANAGWVSKAPIFDGAIDDVSGQLIPDPSNEKFTSFETGLNWKSVDGRFSATVNLYLTKWRNRTETTVNEAADIVTYQRGIDTDSKGVEFEGKWVPNEWVRFDFAGSIGNWTYVNDVPYQQYQISTRTPIPNTGALYIKGLKIGDQPQTGLTAAVTVYPVKGLSVKLQAYRYSRYWSDYDPLSRTNSSDRAQPWVIPSYSLFDLHVIYKIPGVFNDMDLKLFAHVYNLFDKTYVSDATDESSFEAVGLNLASPHTAQRAEVFLGAPMTFNLGAQLSF